MNNVDDDYDLCQHSYLCSCVCLGVCVCVKRQESGFHPCRSCFLRLWSLERGFPFGNLAPSQRTTLGGKKTLSILNATGVDARLGTCVCVCCFFFRSSPSSSSSSSLSLLPLLVTEEVVLLSFRLVGWSSKLCLFFLLLLLLWQASFRFCCPSIARASSSLSHTPSLTFSLSLSLSLSLSFSNPLRRARPFCIPNVQLLFFFSLYGYGVTKKSVCACLDGTSAAILVLYILFNHKSSIWYLPTQGVVWESIV